MDEAELAEALELIQKCTVEQITDVLRRYKDTGRVKITAANKEQLIAQNFRDAVRLGVVTKLDVFELIRESEENGSQHIWYYRPKPGLTALFDADSVAERLFGAGWTTAVQAYPSLYLKPESHVISDFRRSARKPKDWFLKIYGHASVERATGGRDPRENGTFWLEYKTVTLRSVIVIRWNSPDLLEIRAQRDESRRRLERAHDLAWTYLRPAFLRDQFSPWGLSPILGKLVRDSDKHIDLYDFRDARVLEHEGKIMATYETVSDTGSMFDSAETMQELKNKLAAGGKLKGLAVTWLAEKTALEANLRTLIAAKHENETFIPAHCSAKDLDHVTDQLRRFS